MILQKIPQRLAIKYFKTIDQFINADPTVEIFEQLHEAKRVLICVPAKGDDFSVAQQCFNTLGDVFPNALFTLLLRENQILTESVTIPYKLINIVKEYLTSFGFPQKQFVQIIKKKGFDVVIDLTPDFDFINTFICRASGSKLRVCLSDPIGDPFYNFLIRTEPSLPLEKRYEILVHYLKAGAHAVKQP